MRVWGILVLVGLWLSAVPGTVLAHSAMYPDQYKFDQSNEGRKAQLPKR